jgi:jumonji domain-containing protein 7
VPWVESTIYPKPIEPIIITLNKGETLFLPAGWWHAVDQKEGPGGAAVAVN